MARDLIATEYKGHGLTIQFHANTTYENFVGGLAPQNHDRQPWISIRSAERVF